MIGMRRHSDVSALVEEASGDRLVTDRVERAIRGEIEEMRRQGRSMLPRQKELVRRYGTSLRSVREAMGRLQKARLIRSVRGKGTFLVDRPTTTRNVLLVCDSTHYPYQIMCISALTRLLKAGRATTNLVISHDLSADWERIVQKHPGTGGAVLISPYPRDAVAALVHESPIPIVCLCELAERFRGPAVCDAVLPDNQALGYRCVEHLVRQGHRRIALVSWELSQAGGYEIQQGYLKALLAFGIPYKSDLVVELPNLPVEDGAFSRPPAIPVELLRNRLAAWREQGTMPTAMIHGSASELQVRDLLEHCLENCFAADAVVGYLYREQLQTGYNGLGEATAICVSFEGLARRALELLFRPRGPNEPPVREIQERMGLYRRVGGVWREVEA